ncbi:putative ribonuclease H-like domain-containing protein [Tanacetum coccineum]
MPLKYDLILDDEGEYVFSESITSIHDAATNEAKTSVSKPKSVGELLIEDWISDSEDENETEFNFNHLIKDCDLYEKKMVEKTVWNNARRANHQNSQRMTHPHLKGNFVPKVVLMKSGIKILNTAGQNFSKAAVSVNTARPINTAYTRPTVNSARIASNVLNKAHTHVRRPFNRSTTNKNSNLKEKINTVKGDVTTAGPKAVVSNNKGNEASAIKASACWVWRPKQKVLDHVFRHNGASMNFKRFDCVDAQEKGVIDSGCSRYMTGNKSCLSDYEELDGGFVAFGGDPKGGRITGKGKISIGGLTCLFAKATLDESNLWHRRLGYINFKTLNKLVRGNLIRGLPSKIFENNHTCVACQKGKLHKASYKTKTVSSISQPLQMLHMDLFGPTFVKSLMKKMYCLVVTDDYSRFSCVFFLATKDETSEILKTFIIGIENLIDLKVKVIRCDNGTEFKNKVMNQFCEKKGIKREFSVARTPQQNGVAERKNKTLIEAARTMLADLKLPTTFWVEAVNTACYVQNRVLVIKPHNKTPYELFLGRKPALSFMRPFGCPVTILNTLDHLGKFDGKADEGFFVGYSTNSKAYRVFNNRTRIVEENLHVKFSEETPNIAGNGPNWLFDIDALTISMNYKPVVAGNQTNGNAGTKENIDAGQDGKKIVPDQKYILLPLLTSDPSLSKSSKDSPDAGFKPSGEEEKIDSEHQENEDSEVPNTEEPRVNQEQDANVNNTNNINTVSPTVSAADIENNVVDENIVYGCIDDPNMPNLEEIVYSDDDEEVGAEADMNNLATNVPVSPIPTTRVHKDHPLEQIIRDIHSAPQTRRMTKNVTEHGMFSSVQQRINHKDFQNCLFACFLSQVEPKKVIQALTDPSWIEAMQDELLQFKLQKVWTLVDLPYGKRAIGTKWVYRNKKDDRGIVVRNKARLVAQGYTQEEGIDYDEVFAPVARSCCKDRCNYGKKEIEKALYVLHQAPSAWGRLAWVGKGGAWVQWLCGRLGLGVRLASDYLNRDADIGVFSDLLLAGSGQVLGLDPLEDGVRCRRLTLSTVVLAMVGYKLNGGFCLFCTSSDENSSIDAPNSFNDLPNVFTYPPQPQYESYSCELLGNGRSICYDIEPIDSQYLQSIANHDPSLPTLEPEDSLIMGNEELSTIPEKELDKSIKSSVEDLVQIPSESKDTSRSDSDLPLRVTTDDRMFPEENVKIYSNPLFEFDDEYISSDVNPLFDEVLENIESKDSYVSNLDEPALLVTPPLFPILIRMKCFDPVDDVDR